MWANLHKPRVLSPLHSFMHIRECIGLLSWLAKMVQAVLSVWSHMPCNIMGYKRVLVVYVYSEASGKPVYSCRLTRILNDSNLTTVANFSLYIVGFFPGVWQMPLDWLQTPQTVWRNLKGRMRNKCRNNLKMSKKHVTQKYRVTMVF